MNSVHLLLPFRWTITPTESSRTTGVSTHVQHLRRSSVIASYVPASTFVLQQTKGRRARKRKNASKGLSRVSHINPLTATFSLRYHPRDIPVWTGLLYHEVEKLEKMVSQ